MERSGSFRQTPGLDVEHLTGAGDGSEFGRKRSLVRPERQRYDPSHPQYHYQHVAQQQADRIHVQPSTTGNEPLFPTSPSAPGGLAYQGLDGDSEGFGQPRYGNLRPPGSSGPSSVPTGLSRLAEGAVDLIRSGSKRSIQSARSGRSAQSSRLEAPEDMQHAPEPGIAEDYDGEANSDEGENLEGGGRERPLAPPGPSHLNNPYRSHSKETEFPEDDGDAESVASVQARPYMPKDEGISLWAWYCRLLTFPIIPAMMRPFGMHTKERQMAWREKIGLISVILVIAALVGYLTFGFTQTVCHDTSVRIHRGSVPSDNLIICGAVYDFGSYNHPAVEGISSDSPILYPPVNAGGKDGSFLFQNVNGHCKGLIKPKSSTKIPHNSEGDVGWYFPCQIIYPNNNSLVDDSYLVNNASKVDFYSGWGCHTGKQARDALYTSNKRTATVYYTWDDLANTNDHLVVYNGDVLNLDRLKYLLSDDLDYPSVFDVLRKDNILRGQDVSQHFSYGEDRKLMRCLQEITKVGEIDTDTIGCIASDVVLYVSLVFIMGLVIVKFVLACYFRFVIARKQGAFEISPKEYNERERRIEDWGDDEYTPADRFSDTPAIMSARPRSMLLEKLVAPHQDPARATNITMSTQHPGASTSRLPAGGSVQNASLYRMSQPSTAMLDYSSSHHLSTVDTAYYGNEPEPTGPIAGTPDPYQEPDMGSLAPPGPVRAASPFGSLSTGSSSSVRTIEQTLGSAPASSMNSPVISEAPLGPLGGSDDYLVPQPPVGYQPWGYPLAHIMCMVTAYSESIEGLRTTLDSVCTTEYPNSHKLVFIVCDGIVKGSGNDMTTPEICLSMMKDFAQPPEDVQAHSYVSVVSGSKRHNMAKVYAGFYSYDDDTIPSEKQQRVPILLVVKCGTPEEASAAKPGNRGKRDSQIILMSFLQRMMFDERMTELEFEIFSGISNITGIGPDYYEMLLMVDADTKVYPDCLTHMCAEMVHDPMIMGLCGETKIANKRQSWVTMIQVFEYFISHHQAKAFESVFGGVTCLPGCFSMYRIKSPKGAEGYWVPILCNPDIVERYSDNVVDTLHKKNLLLLGEDRFLSTLMLKTFPKRKMMFIPKAACKTVVPDEFKVLMSQRRRWINSTIHNLMELVLVRDLCGVFVISMQFVVFIDLVSTLVLPAALSFTIYVIVFAIVGTPKPIVSLVLLGLILGLPGVLIVVTATRASYVLWMLIYLMALPIWNLVLPTNAYWRFDDFSWGETRAIEGGDKGGHDEVSGEFDSSHIVMKHWREFQRDRARRAIVLAANMEYNNSISD